MLRPLLTLATVHAVICWLAPAQVRACSPIQQGIVSRSLFPPPGTTGVPTNVRVVVRYGATRFYDVPGDAGDPGIGTDLELRTKAGGPVAASRDSVVTGPTIYHRQVAVVLTPAQPLAPATEYEVVDRRPNIPCGPNRLLNCVLGAMTVVGTFTTGAGPLTDKPAAPSGGRLITGAFDRCDSGTCCGPFVVKRFEARWDEAAAGTRLYNVYGGTPGTVLVRLLDASSLNLAVGCAGVSGDPQATWATPGNVRVRAVDWAGQEGPEVELGTIPATVCADAPLAGADLPPEPSGYDARVDVHGDTGVDAGADAAPDSAPPSMSDAQVDGAATGGVVAPPPPRSSGGGCQLGGSLRPGPFGLMALLAVARLARRRRRP